MSNIRRTLVLNPVEPAPISMKLRSGLENDIEIEYLRQNGAPYNTDFGAQMYLISRTSGTVMNYLLPSIDVINGRAKAYIPAGHIKDANGYNVQIIGTVEGETRLIARGAASVYETEALGIIPADMIDEIDITIAYNQDVSIDVALWKDTEKTTPYDLTGVTVTANVYNRQGGSVIAPFSVEKIDANVVRLTLTAGQVNGIPEHAWWSLSVTAGAGLTTLVQGDVLVTGTPSIVFTDVDMTYTYIKAATLAVPASGECLHCTNALDILRFSMYDDDSIDRTEWLKQMAAGGRITLRTPVEEPEEPGPPDPIPETVRLPRDDPEPIPGPEGTLWTIISTDHVESQNYYQFVVGPAAQAPESGDQIFNFAK